MNPKTKKNTNYNNITSDNISIVYHFNKFKEIEKQIEKQINFKRKIDGVINSIDECIKIIKNQDHELHNFLLEDLKKNSYLDVRSVSVYPVDKSGRVLLHRNNKYNSTNKYIPNESHITPIIGICDTSGNRIQTAINLLNDFLGIISNKRELIPIWGDDNDNHTAYFYYVKDDFEEIENIFCKTKLGCDTNKFVTLPFESKVHKSVYYCKFPDISFLDNKFDYNKNDNIWRWTLHRPNGCTAVYNVFQWIVKRKSDLVDTTSMKYRQQLVVNQRIDISISSVQSIIWSILKKGYFENKHFHLGKIGCNLEYCIKHNLQKYVPKNSIPMFEKESTRLKNIYTGHYDYNKNIEIDFNNSFKASAKKLANRFKKSNFTKNVKIIVI